MRRPALFLLFLSVLTFFLGLGRPAITDSDEAFYAESAREMVERGDWLTPFYNYEHRWQKPVLYYWLTAITYVAVGVGEWSARCWSALAGLALAFATTAVGRRLTHRDDVAWLAGAMTATSFGYFSIGRMSLPDLPLALFITLTIAAAFERRWVPAGLAAGLGFLTKGPVALVIPALVLIPVWWRERDTGQVRLREVALAAIVFAVIGLPWYVGMTTTHGAAYLHSFFVGDNFERFATDRFNEPRSFFFYVPIVFGGLLPWTAFLVIGAWGTLRDLVGRRLTLTDTDWRLIIWAGLPLLFFSLSIGKQPRYILPVLPPLAIMIARSMLRRVERAQAGDRGAQRALRGSTLATAALLAAVAVVLWRARALFLTVSPLMTGIAAGTLAASAVMLALASRRVTSLRYLFPTTSAIVLIAIQFGAFAGRRPEPVEEMAALVLRHRTAHEPVGEYNAFVRNLVFYTGFRQENLFNEARAAEFLASSERVLLVVPEPDVARLETIGRVRIRRLGDVLYANTSNLKLPQLLWPLPERDVQRVVLVTNR